MIELKTLCEEIDMPEETTEALLSYPATENGGTIALLTDPNAYADGAKALAERYGNDETGVLRAMLLAALRSRELYRRKGIPDGVFIDTMKCFSRFVREHAESYGSYGFDRGFWVGRQLSLLLFRVGALEYELAEYEGAKAISIHIPSDADLSPQALDRSVADAKAFFRKYYPDYGEAVRFCSSWLLSPALKKLLPENSKIIGFQNRFRIVSVDETPESYKQWVFKNKNLAAEDFPEDTSLQRAMKRFVLSGGKVGEAEGIYRF